MKRNIGKKIYRPRRIFFQTGGIIARLLPCRVCVQLTAYVFDPAQDMVCLPPVRPLEYGMLYKMRHTIIHRVLIPRAYVDHISAMEDLGIFHLPVNEADAVFELYYVMEFRHVVLKY